MGGPKTGLGTEPTIANTGQISVHDEVTRIDHGQLAVGTMVGEYRIEGLLGSGGMGRVYAATHPVIGKRAAIKVLHPALSVEQEAVDRFVQEARAVNQIGHPNIVDIFSFGSLPDGRAYFVMEQLRGESLGERIERARLPLPEVLTILDTIAVALEAAHRKGIVHRDLKPDNVFLVEVEGAAPQVKLLDFGIAKLVGAEVGVSRTRTGNVMGTPAYISPEQARGQGVDHRTDIYALGAVAYELFTGELPFPATNAADMLAKHLFQDPPSARALRPELEPELDELIKRLLAKSADERPTLAETRETLRTCRTKIYQSEALHEGGHTDPVVHITDPRLRHPDELRLSLPIGPPSPSATEFSAKVAREKRWLLGGAALVALAVIVGLVVWLGGDDSPRPRNTAPTEPAATTRPGETTSTATPSTATPSTARPGEIPSAATPGETPSAATPGETPSAATPGETPSAATPGETPATPPQVSASGSASTTKPTTTKPPTTTTKPSTTTKKPTTKKPTKPKPVDDPDAPM